MYVCMYVCEKEKMCVRDIVGDEVNGYVDGDSVSWTEKDDDVDRWVSDVPDNLGRPVSRLAKVNNPNPWGFPLSN